jgi:hypothetical protein
MNVDHKYETIQHEYAKADLSVNYEKCPYSPPNCCTDNVGNYTQMGKPDLTGL